MSLICQSILFLILLINDELCVMVCIILLFVFTYVCHVRLLARRTEYCCLNLVYTVVMMNVYFFGPNRFSIS